MNRDDATGATERGGHGDNAFLEPQIAQIFADDGHAGGTLIQEETL